MHKERKGIVDPAKRNGERRSITKTAEILGKKDDDY